MSNSTSGANKKSLERIFGSSFEWESKHGFQHSVVENASQRIRNRVVGHFMHNNLWKDDADGSEFMECWNSFEKKHLKAYYRWKKVSHTKGGVDQKSKDLNLDKRVQYIFLYYLTYGEINDFRNMKNVFHLFFHNVVERYDQNAPSPKLGEWIRDQGQKLYKIMGTVYSNTEMNQDCFLHDDLDDLCASATFLKKWSKEKDFFTAFDVAEGNEKGKSSSKFPYMAKLLREPQDKYIKYWHRSSQSALRENERDERDEWTKINFWDDSVSSKKKSQLEEIEKELASVREQLKVAAEAKRSLEENNKSVDRPYHPTESEFEDRDTFSHAWTDFETSKEIYFVAEKIYKSAEENYNAARSVHFRNKAEASKHFEDATKKFKEAEAEFQECVKGFDRAISGFQSLQPIDLVQFQLSECKLFRARAYWLASSSRERQYKSQYSMILQSRFEDALNGDRKKFANKYKTFVEKAAGPAGLTGYLTVLQHYSTAIFLHFWLMIPLIVLLWDWDSIANLPNSFGDMNVLMSTQSPIIFLAVPIVLAVFFIVFLLLSAWRTSGYRAPRRDSGTRMKLSFTARLNNLWLWICVIITEIAFMKFLVLDPIMTATEDFVDNFDYIKTPILMILHWVPVVILFFSSVQFIFSLWIGIFGFFYGIRDGVQRYNTWTDLQKAFDETNRDLPSVIEMFHKSMMPEDKTKMDKENKEVLIRRRTIAFARVWNEIVKGFYDIHQLSKEEWQTYSYKIKNIEGDDFLNGIIEKKPNFKKEPQIKTVRYHLVRFVNSVFMKKPNKKISVREMLPVTVVTPVGAEKIIYPYEYITHVDNTQNSFLQHLIQKQPHEWANFIKKEATTAKAVDFLSRLEKDILQGVQPDQNKKRWIHNTKEGIELKLRLCEWGSLRFQALFRTIHGFMQIPKALVTLARVQEPKLTLSEAEELVRVKFSYVVGYQSFGSSYRLYKQTKEKASQGLELNKREMEAHDAVFNIKYIKRKFPAVRIAYPDYEQGKYVGKLTSGNSNGVFFDYTIELFGPFVDMGLGKPTHQNFLSQFIDGMVIQTIDVNQDNVISQSFFVPNLVAEFDVDKSVKIVGCPEFVFTEDWSSTAWCSAFTEHTFGSLVQRAYSRLGIRLHYGHPDYLDALWVMTETGMSKMPYVSEDIFTGFDTVIKGGRIIHSEYLEVGKARDVDLYTTTKFIRKISMGASQMACTRYIQQVQSSANVSFLQRLSLYYATTGFYLNHLMLYISVWFALVSQVLMVIIQKYIFEDSISDFMINRVFSFQVGFTLMAPGVLQLVLEFGVFLGIWKYITHFLILCVYSTFHILNTSSYWQWGLTKTAFYLASGRGSGLEHYFMKDMYNTFYTTHWRAGFLIFWLGIFTLILSGNFLVFAMMFLLPSGIWLWGAMFLNPGALPSSVHEEQWKRLMNRDMKETSEIVKAHSNEQQGYKPGRRITRGFSNFIHTCHWLYVAVNFAIHTRVIRFLALFVLAYDYVMASKLPTFIFTDDRRRILRWDEEETRQKSIFFSNMAKPSSQMAQPTNTDGTPKLSEVDRFKKQNKLATRSVSINTLSPVEEATKGRGSDKQSRRLVFINNSQRSTENLNLNSNNNSGFGTLKSSMKRPTDGNRITINELANDKKSLRKPLPKKPEEHVITEITPSESAEKPMRKSKDLPAEPTTSSSTTTKPLPVRPRSSSAEPPQPPPKPSSSDKSKAEADDGRPRSSSNTSDNGERPSRPRSSSRSSDKTRVIRIKKDLPVPPKDDKQ